jgi:RNA polymerase sigma-70 factor (ECF subfamily)
VADLLGTTTTAVNSGLRRARAQALPAEDELAEPAEPGRRALLDRFAAAMRRPPAGPPGLAAVLLPVAAMLITPHTRPGLFAGPVRLPAPACAGDQLVAFTGRQPLP